jgi:diacylglycerol kinase family enzyme
VRLLLVVNASASSVTARVRVVIQKALAADHNVSVAETSRRGHATRLAQGAAAEGADAVVVLGGDGTLNEAANGLAGTQTALGVLPGGSTNVFARTIGMTNDPVEATGELLAALGAGSVRPVGLGQVNRRYFLFHLGLGFDAAVVSEVEKRAVVKRWFGAVVFLASAVSTWTRGFDRRSPAFGVEATGVDLDDGRFAVCLNTDPYTFLGARPLHLAPGTGLDSGLSLVVFRSLGLPTLLGAAMTSAGVIGSRRSDPLARRRRVVVVRDLDRLEVRAVRPLPYQVDGDYLGVAEQFHVRHVPDALRLVVPTTPSAASPGTH